MSEKTSGGSSGVGLFGLLFILFVGLKLTGFIDWSWWWLTAPLWGGFATLFLLAFMVTVLAALGARGK